MQFVLVGDVMLGRLVNRALRRVPPEYPWGNTLPLFAAADWRGCNLECVLSDRGVRWTASPKDFHFRSDTKNAAVLRSAHIDVVSLANNHVLDFGYKALREMLSILDVAQIAHAGAGAELAAARRPVISTVAGTRLAFVAFTDNEPGWEATPERPGVFYVPTDLVDDRARVLFELVSHTRSQADIVVVSAHWGPNCGYQPPAEHIDFAHRLVDAGADVVFGHSGHVFRGIELYKRRPIIYCAGDFVDDYAVDAIERNDEAFIFSFETSASGIKRIVLHPALIADRRACRARGADVVRIAQKMERLCLGFGTPLLGREADGQLEISVA
jgi:poly-gamma-glutamate capsule biosynthesis protein CapA/YwtB (metallophosphatase superfamily)